jgi:hypothetical protein
MTAPDVDFAAGSLGLPAFSMETQRPQQMDRLTLRSNRCRRGYSAVNLSYHSREARAIAVARTF